MYRNVLFSCFYYCCCLVPGFLDFKGPGFEMNSYCLIKNPYCSVINASEDQNKWRRTQVVDLIWGIFGGMGWNHTPTFISVLRDEPWWGLGSHM